MQKYKVIVTWEAVYDITEIADYYRSAVWDSEG
ncbi:hypothetical protein C823_003486 [Eubacterium plexicaudatum ASF492]|uniref:Uncharacterized protein n=1 Tax=Eubacterium plexicaudatum ASF492 TaxID=1235802 RepID=N2AUK3_9FIRM|nr:hypothetical protein C823_003486 [Eubacterium plexicaudatum ASF492]